MAEMTEATMETLAKLAGAVRAKDEIPRLAVLAYRRGARKVDVASVAGITRVTLNKWIAEDDAKAAEKAAEAAPAADVEDPFA